MPGLYLLNSRCTYASVVTILLKLLNRSHWMTTFFSSACTMKTDEGIFSSTEAEIRFTCSVHPLSGRFYQAGPVSRSLLFRSSISIAPLPMSAGLLIPLTCFHCEASVVSSISATQLATNTCCLQWQLGIHFNIIVESDQKWQLFYVHLVFSDCSIFQPHCHKGRLLFQLRYWEMPHRCHSAFSTDKC